MRQILTNNHFNGRAGYQPRYIILHATAGGTSAEAIAHYFQETEGSDEPVSSNIVIGTDGEAVECVPSDIAAYGNGILEPGHDPWWSPDINPNFLTISIEHCKASQNNSDLLTDAQKATSFAVIKALCTQWDIPMHRADANGGITGHYSISPQSRAHCPGPYPLDELIAYLNQGANTMTIPQGWTDDGKTLMAPNNVPITDGFRLYVLSHNWDSNNIPLQPAQGLTQLELANPGIGGGTQQIFRWSVLEWTQQHGVFEAWCGQELLATRVRLAQAQSKLAQAAPAPQDITTLNDLKSRLAQINTLSKVS